MSIFVYICLMTKEYIQKLIDDLPFYKPVKEIENEIKMPPTTLQKYLKGDRALPKKWVKPLEAYFGLSIKTEVESLEEIKKPGKPIKNKPQIEIRKPFMSDAIKKKLGIK